jgi:hypothetical protein
MSMVGKMSTGIEKIPKTPNTAISSDITVKV